MSLLLHYMDDIHLEHHRDGGRSFLGSLHYPEVEVLALGGDITNYGDLLWQVPLFQKAYPNAQIVYSKGNHEFYGGKVETALKCFDVVARTYPFVHLLEPGIEVTLKGHRFIGATMWFRDWDPRLESLLNDFRAIQCQASGGFQAWIRTRNQEWVDFYEANGKPGDIVITHHIPTWKAVSPQFAGEPSNCFYVCDVEHLILKNKPKLWLHGHCHDPIDMLLGETRIVRNPLGYPHQIKPFWTPKEIVLE